MQAVTAFLEAQTGKLNGKPLNRAWVTTRELNAPSGCRLEYELGPEPNLSLFTEPPPR